MFWTFFLKFELINQCRLVSESIVYPSSGLFDPRSGQPTQPLQGFSTS
jgi:hypothetical protein